MRSRRRLLSRRCASLGVLTLPLLLAGGVAAAPSATADADITIVGGDAAAKIVCGNVATAKALAAQRGIALQRNDCDASSSGGNVLLSDVDILISAAARTASPDNAVLAALVEGTAPATARVAADVCKPLRPRTGADASGRAVQRNICWVKGEGGRAKSSDTVVGVVTHPDGTTSRRTFSAARLPTLDGIATARCTNVNAQLVDQADACTSTGTGGSLQLRGVTVVQHLADGSMTTRKNIAVTVRGGAASSELYCFNVVDGAGKVVQINLCRGTATGGDVTLRNVKVVLTG